MVGFLIEEYAGAFPVWLAPTQVTIIPVAESFNDHAATVHQALKEAKIRVKTDDSSDSFAKKIRNGEMMKVPYLLILGQQELDNQTVNVREYHSKKQYEIATAEFVTQIVSEYHERRLPNQE